HGHGLGSGSGIAESLLLLQSLLRLRQHVAESQFFLLFGIFRIRGSLLGGIAASRNHKRRHDQQNKKRTQNLFHSCVSLHHCFAPESEFAGTSGACPTREVHYIPINWKSPCHNRGKSKKL